MNLTTYVQDFYVENNKTSLKAYEEDLIREIRNLWVGKTQSHKILILHKLIYRFNAFPLKISTEAS